MWDQQQKLKVHSDQKAAGVALQLGAGAVMLMVQLCVSRLACSADISSMSDWQREATFAWDEQVSESECNTSMCMCLCMCPFSYLPVLAGQTLARMIARLSQFDDSIE